MKKGLFCAWKHSKRAYSAVFFAVFSASLPARFALAQTDLRAQALALEQQNRNAEAEEIWQKVAAANPKNPEPYARVALLESRRENYPAAIENYRKALELGPPRPGIEMNLGLACFKMNRFPEAVKAFSAELRTQPPDSPIAARLTILLGMSHYGMRDYFVAIPYLQRAAAADPSSLPLRLTLAHSCLWSKQYPCVINTFQEILALNADSAEADMLAGEALDEIGDDAGAISQFRAAALADPKQPNVHFGLGYLLWKEKHFDEAAREFQSELDNNPAQQQARSYLGDSLVELNQYDTALPVLERATSEPSATAMVHRDLGVVYADAGRKEDAANELLKAIVLDPRDVSPHWRLGRLYRSMGKKDDAKTEFDLASAMQKENSRPLAQEIGEEAPKPQP